MAFYHGTSIAGITSLTPRSRHHVTGEKVVYATDCEAYALVYIRDMDIDFVTSGVTSDGTVQYDERFENQLEILYRGRSGYIYTLADVGFRPLAGKRGVWAAGAEAPVTACRFIPDVYEALQEHRRAGRLRVSIYSQLTPKARRECDEMAVVGLFAMDLAGLHPKKAVFYKTYFADAWDFVTRNPGKKAEYLEKMAKAR